MFQSDVDCKFVDHIDAKLSLLQSNWNSTTISVWNHFECSNCIYLYLHRYKLVHPHINTLFVSSSIVHCHMPLCCRRIFFTCLSWLSVPAYACIGFWAAKRMIPPCATWLMSILFQYLHLVQTFSSVSTLLFGFDDFYTVPYRRLLLCAVYVRSACI